MSISIVDNFQVGVSKPIDSRFVVGPGFFYTTRDDIQNKYTGLRIWDINENKAYIWKGNQWDEESTGGKVGTGNTGAIPKFITSTTIGDSIMIESTGRIIVNGILQATNLSGNGSNITAINATYITSGSLDPKRLVGKSNEVLVGTGTGSTWKNLNTLTVGTSNKAFLLNSTSSNTHYLTFGAGNSSSQQLFSNVLLAYQPSTGNLSLSTTNFNNKLTVNGSVSIGTDTTAPDLGLLVGGSVRLTGLGQFTSDTNLPKFTIVSSGNDFSLKLDTGTTVPLGGIIIWTSIDIPEGFVICDGSTYQNYLGLTVQVPDLRAKYPIGSLSGQYELNNEGLMQTLSEEDISYKYLPVHFIIYIGTPNILISSGE